MSTAEVEAFLAGYAPEVRELAARCRDLVLRAVPGLVEQVDVPGKLLGYGFKLTYRDTVCVIMPLKDGINLGFPRGVDLANPAGLLQGTGKRARHVRLRKLEDLESPALRALLAASAAQIRPQE